MPSPPPLSTAAIRAAVASPLALGMLVVGEAAAVAIHSIPLGAIGLVSYAALVAWDLVRAQEPPEAKPPPAPVLPSADSLHDPDARAALRSLQAAREQRERALALTPDAIRGTVQGALGTVDDLERHAAALLERCESLHGWLGGQDRTRLAAELSGLEERIRVTTDDTARADYGRARDAKAAQVRAVADIVDARERILANLARLVATLEGLPPQLVRLRALDEAALDRLGDELGGQLDELNGEMKLFETTLQSLATDAPWPPPPARSGVPA